MMEKHDEVTTKHPHISLKKRIVSYFHPEGIEKDMLRYRSNSISSNLSYLGIALDACAFCVIYSTTKISKTDNFTLLGINNSGFWAGFDVLLNIVTLLFLFMASSRMKNYSKGWGIFSIALGAFFVVRPFLYPLSLFNSGILPATPYTWSVILFICSGACLIIAGFLSIYRGAALRKYLKTVKAIENEKVQVK